MTEKIKKYDEIRRQYVWKSISSTLCIFAEQCGGDRITGIYENRQTCIILLENFIRSKIL